MVSRVSGRGNDDVHPADRIAGLERRGVLGDGWLFRVDGCAAHLDDLGQNAQSHFFWRARTNIDAYMAEEMGKLTGGLPLPPGFKLPF